MVPNVSYECPIVKLYAYNIGEACACDDIGKLKSKHELITKIERRKSNGGGEMGPISVVNWQKMTES